MRPTCRHRPQSRSTRRPSAAEHPAATCDRPTAAPNGSEPNGLAPYYFQHFIGSRALDPAPPGPPPPPPRPDRFPSAHALAPLVGT